MSNGPESLAAARAVEADVIGNRKLIRPSLSREQARLKESAAEQRERNARAPQQAGKKLPPADQTHAESFYYQKQMQSKTPMVVVIRDGEQLHGVIEWYDKNCIKLNRPAGQSNLLIYKSAIRYMFKEGEENK
jgi:host factor-I protein